jgi:hypothetical protein
MVLDLALLLRYVVSKHPFDSEYFAARINSSPQTMKEQCADNLERFGKTIRHSTVLDDPADEVLYRSIDLLKKSFELATRKTERSSVSA